VKGALVGIAVVLMLAVGGILIYVRATGLRARAEPGRVEIALARRVRRWAVPAAERNRANPVSRTPAVEREGLEHFADHCASCHANDGSGNTEMGKGLYPPAPDMRLAATQQMTDGELFYVIEHGIRFTGMPGWSTATPGSAASPTSRASEESSWHLVHFIRRLPNLSQAEIDEMAALNPRSPAEVREEIERQHFLEGSDVRPEAPSKAPEHHHAGGH
jgi:mono/diheme cytochrome c family protein